MKVKTDSMFIQKIIALILIICSSSFFLNTSANPRKVVLLDRDWKFVQKDVNDAGSPGFSDDNWETVTVPHDWAIDKAFDLNIDRHDWEIEEDGEKRMEISTGRTGALPAYGVGWYRRNLPVTPEDEGKRISVELDGAMSNAKVYVNGNYVGEWPYGYSSFRFDITDYIEFGQENLLAVRLETKGLSSRWYPGAGIYRDVRLVITEPVHVAHWGTYITTPEIDKSAGLVNIETIIENHGTGSDKVKLVTEIMDPAGKLVASSSANEKISAKGVFTQRIRVPEPALWSIETPHLYKAVSKVYVGKALKDIYETTFGFRTIRFDKDHGFFLNGNHVDIKGVNLHHTLGPLGAESNFRATERQLEIMQEMGCNAIRSAHNPPSVELLDLCDRMGLLVIDESFDEWKVPKVENGYNKLFDEWAEKDMLAMIHRDRNHPSIIIWSIGNEVLEQQYPDDPAGKEISKFLTGICHREDPTRPTVGAFNNVRGAIANGMGDEVDIFGINYLAIVTYPTLGGYSYEEMHAEKPDYILLGTETSCVASSRGEYKFPLKEDRYPWYKDYHLSSYDLEGPMWYSTPDTDFAMYDDCDAVAGDFVWSGFDYLGEPTPYNEGTPAKSSYIGIVDLAGLKKDRFYLYQSQWSDKPMMHVVPHWNWPDRMNDTVPVMCYTNHEKAELFVKGKSMGVKSRTPDKILERYRLVWWDVVYQPGEIKMVALDKDDNPVDSRVIKTAGEPYQVRLTPDRPEIAADGKDLCFITVEILDEEGNLCPRADIIQFFNVQGPGTLKALCNGDPTDLTPFSAGYMSTFNGKLIAIVQSTMEKGSIILHSKGSMMKGASLTIESK